MSHKRMIIARRRKRTVLKEKIYLVMIAAVIVIICSFVFGGFFTDARGNAQEAPVSYKYYKSIEIKDGDTLWDIAKEYMTDDYNSTEEYVNELKQMNHLTSDNIHDSQFIAVAYNDTKFKK